MRRPFPYNASPTPPTRGEVAAVRAPSMLKALRKLFVSDPVPNAEGKITLADVLKHNWFELWYQPKIELRTMRLGQRGAGSVSPGPLLLRLGEGKHRAGIVENPAKTQGERPRTTDPRPSLAE